MEKIILVDKNDAEIGIGRKSEVHLNGDLHRAFSIFIFNSKGDFLLQRRSKSKYHSPGLWTNTCCSHHLPGKTLEDCALNRLKFEMGMNCQLAFQFKFHYTAQLDNQMIENEIDHVYFGTTDELPIANDDEVMAWKYLNRSDLIKLVNKHPEEFTEWFKIAINQVLLHL